MKILIATCSRSLRDGSPNRKHYPYWAELVTLLQQAGHQIIQLTDGTETPLVTDARKNLPLTEVEILLKETDIFITIDSFLQHLAHSVGVHGIVLWSPTNPRIFGYPENCNLFVNEKYLRKNQFADWEECEATLPESFVSPETVLNAVNNWNKKVTVAIHIRHSYHTTLSMLLLSLATQTVKPQEIVLVDDSTERHELSDFPILLYALEILRDKGIRVKLIYGQQQGRHKAYKIVDEITKNLIWRINDDHIPEPNALENLLSVLTDDVGAVGARMRFLEIPLPEALENKIEQYAYSNIQVYVFDDIREVDYLRGSFLYRSGIGEYPELSIASHNEDMLFSHSIKRKGYKLLVNGSAIVNDFPAIVEDILPNESDQNEKNDTAWLIKKFEEWKIAPENVKIFILDAGLGDCISFKRLLPELKQRYDKVIIASCYTELFDGEFIISIKEANRIVSTPITHDVYWFMAKHNWNQSVEQAYRQMYLN